MDRFWLRPALWVAGLLVAAWVLGRFSNLMATAVVVAVVTFPVFPLVDRLETRARMPRGAAAGLALLGLAAVLVLGVMSVIPWIIHQGQVLMALAPQGIAAVTEFLSGWQARVAEPTFPHLLRTAWERAGETAIIAANAAVARTVNVAARSIGQLYLLLLVPFAVYFVLLDYRPARAAALSLVPAPGRARMEALLATLTTTLRWGLWAQVVVSSIVGVLTAAGLALAGVPGPLAIGVFAGVAEAVPYIGGFATYGVALLAAAPEGGAVWAWALLVVTAVKLLANVLVPLVLGRMTRIHPLAIIVALLALGQLFGLLGMFFAVPVVVVVREIITWWRPAAAPGSPTGGPES